MDKTYQSTPSSMAGVVGSSLNKPISSVDKEMNNLEDMVLQVQTLTNLVRDRLSPVLLERPEEENRKEAVEEMLSALPSNIRNQRQRLESVSRNLSSLLRDMSL